MIEKKVDIMYKSLVEEGMKVYRKQFENIKIEDKTIEYWKNAATLYDTFNKREKEVFFDIIEQVIIDTTASVFGLLEGSSSLPEGGVFETDIKIDGIDTEHLLQDYFLSIVFEKKKEQM